MMQYQTVEICSFLVAQQYDACRDRQQTENCKGWRREEEESWMGWRRQQFKISKNYIQQALSRDELLSLLSTLPMTDNTDGIFALEVLAYLQLFVVLFVQRENALLHCDFACAYFLFWGEVDAVTCSSEVARFAEDNLLGFCEIGHGEVGCFLQDCLLGWSQFDLLGGLLLQQTVQLLIFDGFLIKIDLSFHPRTAQLPPSMSALALSLLSSQVPDLFNLGVHISSAKLLTKASIGALMLILLTTAILGMDVLLAMLMADRSEIAFLLSVDAGKQGFCVGQLRQLLH